MPRAHRSAWPATTVSSFLNHGLLDSFEQLTGLKGLAQKGYATGLECLLAHCLVLEGGHERICRGGDERMVR